MTRYTKEDALKFMAEEEKRNAEEAAAYFAWKRGEIPLDSETPTPTYIPPTPNATPSPPPRSPDETDTTASPTGTKHLFEDLGMEEDEEFNVNEKIDIDSINVEDSSPTGRERRMKAMANELAEFSAGQRQEAERRERERVEEGLKEGRKVMDQFGQRFEEMTPRSTRRRPK
jgi:hypothetical protein